MLRWFGSAAALLSATGACVGELEGSPAEYLANRPPPIQTNDGGTSVVGDGSPDVAQPSSCPPVSQIFEDNVCTNPACHGGGSPQADLKLDVPNPATSLLGQPSTAPGCEDRLLIDPNSPMNSYLLEKLEDPIPQCGDRMPFGSTLSADDLECVREWIVSAAGGA